MSKARIIMASAMMVLMLFGVAGLGYAGEEAPKFKLKLQSFLPPEQTKEDYGALVDRVKAMTGGEIEITFFPINALVPVKEIMTAVGRGAIDMGSAPGGYFHKLVPVSEIEGGLPFAFTNINQAYYFMFQGGFLDILRKSYAKQNVHNFTSECYPIALMTRKPIKSIEDLKGVKLRAFGTMAMWLQKMGAATTYISGAELYTALATGVVDGAHWGAASPSYKMRLHEVLKNYMLPEPIVGAWNSIFINMDIWKKMTPRQQAIMEAATRAYCTFEGSTADHLTDDRALRDMVENWDVKVNRMPESDVRKMEKFGQEVWEEVAAKDPLNKEAITLLKNFLADKTVWMKKH
jgi:TRAP-type C4-dicarboxylate transport system substrate-binding protein